MDVVKGYERKVLDTNISMGFCGGCYYGWLALTTTIIFGGFQMNETSPINIGKGDGGRGFPSFPSYPSLPIHFSAHPRYCIFPRVLL